MLLRYALVLILILLVARAFWRIVDGFLDGLTGGESTLPRRGVQTVRDPVCGTFLAPERAVVIADGSQRVYFCSTACRDKYRARTA
jgi:YHS domain-containing protein